jgi:fermentation-respiration switch protein FrsA (DUF1100 family)
MTRAVLGIAALLVALYLALCAWMAMREADFIYYPGFTRIDAAQTDFALERDGVVLRGWATHPGQRDAIIYFGGNAESLQPMRDALATWFPGRSAYLLAYRGYGASEGAPGEVAITADALALYDEVRRRHPDGSIVLIGRSLGSGVASRLAPERPVSRLVLITPFDSLLEVARSHAPWLPVELLMQERYESARYLADYRGPVLIIRAGRDRVVPPASTDRLIAALPQPPRIVAIDDADHNDVDRAPAFRAALERFLR